MSSSRGDVTSTSSQDDKTHEVKMELRKCSLHSLFANPFSPPPLMTPAGATLGIGLLPLAGHGTARLESQILVAVLNLVDRGHVILAGDV